MVEIFKEDKLAYKQPPQKWRVRTMETLEWEGWEGVNEMKYKCEDCGKKVKVLRDGQCVLCHAAHPKPPNDIDQYTESVMQEELWVCPQCLTSGRARNKGSDPLRIYRERPSRNCQDHFTIEYVRLKASRPTTIPPNKVISSTAESARNEEG